MRMGVFEARGCFDHLRERFHIDAEAVGKRKPFKFTNAVVDMPEFLKLIEDYWKDAPPLFESTSALFRFSKSLKALKPLTRQLSKEKPGKLSMKVKEDYHDLCEKHERLLNNPSQGNIKEKVSAAEHYKKT